MVFKSTEAAKIWQLNKYALARWVALFGVLMFIGSLIVLAWIENDNAKWTTNAFTIFWINWLGYFTVQSNIIVGLFMIIYWLNPKSKWVNGNWLVYMVTYITVTFCLYWILLFPGAHFENWKPCNWAINVFQHLLIPLSAFIFYGIYLWKNKKDHSTNWNYWMTVGMGMIYPCCYVIYACILPFIDGHNFSVYGDFTNLDPQCTNPDTGHAGSPMALIYIFGTIVFFFVLLMLYNLAFAKRFNKSNKKNK